MGSSQVPFEREIRICVGVFVTLRTCRSEGCPRISMLLPSRVDAISSLLCEGNCFFPYLDLAKVVGSPSSSDNAFRKVLGRGAMRRLPGVRRRRLARD